MRVLVADNNPQHRQEIADSISALGHSVEESLIPQDVIQAFHTKAPDVAFIDTGIEGMGCFELISILRKLGGRSVWSHIVLTSHLWDQNDIEKGIRVGIDDFLIKPIDPLQLQIKLHSAQRHEVLRDEVFTVAHDLVLANRALEGIVTENNFSGVAKNICRFEEALERAWFKTKKVEQPLSLILLDLDYFHAYNQTYGPEKGDACIEKIVMTLEMVLPDKEAILVRRVGVSYAVILPDYTKPYALSVAQEFKRAVDGLKLPHKTSGCSSYVSVSIGVSSTEGTQCDNPSDLSESADYALYQAKHQGRNQIQFA